MKFILPLIMLLGIASGCASVIEVASREGLQRMEPPRRADYRTTLDQIDEAIDQGKKEYDKLYDRDGNPIVPPVVPVPMPEPEPTPEE